VLVNNAGITDTAQPSTETDVATPRRVNALAPGLRATGLNRRAADLGGDPAEAAALAAW